MRKRKERKPQNIAIGAAIAKARKAEGISQTVLAERLGVKQQSVGEWERGDTAPIGARLEGLFRLLPTFRHEMGLIGPHDSGRRTATGVSSPPPPSYGGDGKLHFSIRAADFRRLTPEQQQHVQGLIDLITETVKRAGGRAEPLDPAYKS